MNNRQTKRLDQHITGNWGEDSVGPEPPTMTTEDGQTLTVSPDSCIKVARSPKGVGYASPWVLLETDEGTQSAQIWAWPPGAFPPYTVEYGYGDERQRYAIERSKWVKVINQLTVTITRSYPHQEQTLEAVTPHIEAWARHTCRVQIDAPYSKTADPYNWREDLHPLPAGARVQSSPSYGFKPFTGTVSRAQQVGPDGWGYRVETDDGRVATPYESDVEEIL